ncbi:MAG: NFACT family protein [Candidatus Micrarchaeota archaeon]
MQIPVQKMSNADYALIERELQVLVGGHLGKIYEIRQNLFRFKIRTDKEFNFMAEPGIRAHLSKYIEESPETPSNFVMALRKYLDNAQITAIRQVNGDRLLAFSLRKKEEYVLYLEMFARGNIIITGPDSLVIELYRPEKSKTRTIKRREPYSPPENPHPVSDVSGANPEVFYIDGKPVGFSSLKTDKFKAASPKPFPSVSEMADEYYFSISQLVEGANDEEAIEPDISSLKKLEFTLRQQHLAHKKFEAEVQKHLDLGNYVYNDFENVEKNMKFARELKRQKKADPEIASEITSQFGIKAEIKGDILTIEVPDPKEGPEGGVSPIEGNESGKKAKSDLSDEMEKETT